MEWIISGDFNMVEWSRGKDDGVGSVISDLGKQALSRCEVALQVFDPDSRKRNLNYQDWFTWCNFHLGKDRVQA
jgi:hypothetical protein